MIEYKFHTMQIILRNKILYKGLLWKKYLFDIFMQLWIEELLYRIELQALFVLAFFCHANINDLT